MLLTINTKESTAGRAAKDQLAKMLLTINVKESTEDEPNKTKPEKGKHNKLGWHP